jgi:hypothetical protein
MLVVLGGLVGLFRVFWEISFVYAGGSVRSNCFSLEIQGRLIGLFWGLWEVLLVYFVAFGDLICLC